jgi:Zn-dependent protease
MEEFLRQVCVWALPVLAAIVFHEVSHGYVAYRLGDPTAARHGRLTLNPIAHVDVVGTILLPALLLLLRMPFVFGYAKPVPVNYANLGQPRRDMMLVALAGPTTNVVLAVVSALAMHALMGAALGAAGRGEEGLAAALTPLALMARNAVLVNVVLAVFNLLPLPPLDGGRVVAGLLPRAPARLFARLEPVGFLLVAVLLVSDGVGVLIGPVIRLLLGLLL